MLKLTDLIQKKPWVGWVVFLGTLTAVFVAGLLATSIMERRAESKTSFEWITPIGEWESKSKVWGENFPQEYQTWLATRDKNFKSKYHGSAMIDMLELNPGLVLLWAGYGFSKDYNQGRGHAYAVSDVHETLRTDEKTPGTCWTCKSPDVPRMMHQLGTAEFYKEKWLALGPEIKEAIGCLDCHDPKTMKLRVSRPALIEAFERQGKNIQDATHQEMRSLVCAQCHVEYYFKGKQANYLTFPWDQGQSVEEMEAYYDSYEFSDWVHTISQAPMIKPQHPDWEIFQTGIHAQRGLACADCHMPFRTEGGVKYTNHQIQSPLNMIPSTCQVCHRESEETLRKTVYERQDKIKELRTTAETELVQAHFETKAAREQGASAQALQPVLKLIRHAQWRWDFVAASHGASFHSPLECARILGSSIQKAQQARIELARILTRQGVKQPVALPDISTKAKAQAYLGLDIAKEKARKQKFKQDVLPGWNAEPSTP